MKKFTLFIVLVIILCGAITLSAQSEITRRSDFFDNITHAVTMNDGNIVVLSQRGGNTHPEIYTMDKNLVIISSFSLPSEIYKINGMVRGTDNSVFVTGRIGGCDYGFGEQSLIKIVLGFFPLWERTFEVNQSYNYFNNELLKTGPNGGVWINEGDLGNTSWVLYDSGGDIVDGAGSPSAEWSDSYAAVTSDDQYIYAATTATAPNPAQLLKLDYDLQLISQRDWNVGKNVKAMTTDGNGNITVIGNDYYHMYATEIDSSFNFVHENTDVGIVEILDAEVSYTDDWHPYWITYGTLYRVRNTKIVIQNFGTEPITSCEINAFYHSGCVVYCGEDVYETYQWSYNDLLLPSEQDTLDMGDMDICLNYDYDYGDSFCFYTTRPNSIVDKNQDNDRFCGNFQTFLPIELLTPLQAKIENRIAILTWETATETNNEGFEIQKSRDGITWQKIAWVDGRGNALTPHTYTYTDENLLSGITYYRFKQLDVDGASTYSNVANVRHTATNISIQPNPVKNTLHITNLNDSTIEHINIFDQTGRQVISTKTANNTVDVSDLSTGIYIIEIHFEGGTLHEKIVVE